MAVPEGIWDNIEQNLERRDNRPTSWFFLLTLLVGLPALFYSYYIAVNDGKASNASDSVHLIAESKASDFFEMDYYSNVNSYYDYREDVSILAPLSMINSSSGKNLRSLTNNQLNLGFQIASGASSYLESNNKITDERISDVTSSPSIATLRPESLTNQLDLDLDKLWSSKTECPDFKPAWPGAYFYGNANMYMPSEKLSSPSGEFNNLISQRRETESPLPSFALELGGGYEFHSGIFVQAGIMLNRTNIKFLYRKEDIINTTTSIVIDTIYNSEGEVTAINKDTSVIHEVGVREVSGTNRFNTIDIPVWVGMAYPLNEKFNLRASMGMALNISASSSGKMVDYEGEPYDYNSTDNPMFKSNYGLSYMGALALESKINEHLSFDAGLNFRYFTKNINIEETNPVNQKFLNFGLTAGLRYRL